jgi:hypothetical protein
MILLRGPVAATYRDRGPQAHQPTGSAAHEARIPIGVELAAAIALNRCWLPPMSQPAANWLGVTQNAMHQQRRVVLWLSNSLARSGTSFGPTGRVSMSALTNGNLPRRGPKPTGNRLRSATAAAARWSSILAGRCLQRAAAGLSATPKLRNTSAAHGAGSVSDRLSTLGTTPRNQRSRGEVSRRTDGARQGTCRL